jgi:hypothetical protein
MILKLDPWAIAYLLISFASVQAALIIPAGGIKNIPG